MPFSSFKTQALLTALFLSHCVADTPPIAGLLGGFSSNPVSGYAAIISPTNGVTPLSFPTNTVRQLNSVALNNSGLGLMGGRAQGFVPFAAFVSSDHGVEIIHGLPTVGPGELDSVAINNAGLGLLGGYFNVISTPPVGITSGYAAFVSRGATPTPIPLNLTDNGQIFAVALNDSGQGLIGGMHQVSAGPAYAALVSPNTSIATEIPLNLPAGFIVSAAINNSNLGLIGGSESISSTDPTYAAFIVQGVAVRIPLNTTGHVHSVALNSSNLGLIGGLDSGSDAYFVTLGAPPQGIPNLPSTIDITSVSLNDSGQGLIGGFVTGAPPIMYAAFVSPGATPTPILGLPKGFLESVSINQFNQGLLGGQTNTNLLYAAIVSPSGLVTALNLGTAQGDIFSVAINAFSLSQLPTTGLSGNNLIFANYINENVPQNVFYFVPSLVDGSFAKALESAAPTRNAISFVTVLQNAFYLTTNLSSHLRSQRPIQSRAPVKKSSNATTLLEEMDSENDEEFLASRCFPKPKPGEAPQPSPCAKKESAPAPKRRSCTVWVDGIGALAFQDAQHETPAFNPATGGATLAVDADMSDSMIFGGGATYLYTHIHEKQGMGHSNIQQEDLFVYGSWQPGSFYVDLGLWGGLFQTKQTRQISPSGFAFTATSKPHGWQLVPHLELGFLSTARRTEKVQVDWNLLGMADWAHAWQRKYKEHGSGPFNVQQGSHHGSLLRTEGSLRFIETFFFRTWNLILQEKGGYVNVQSFNAGKLHAFIINSPGSFTVETLNNSQNLGVVQLSVTGAPYRCCFPATTLFYQGEFGSRYQSHQLNLELAWSF